MNTISIQISATGLLILLMCLCICGNDEKSLRYVFSRALGTAAFFSIFAGLIAWIWS